MSSRQRAPRSEPDWEAHPALRDPGTGLPRADHPDWEPPYLVCKEHGPHLRSPTAQAVPCWALVRDRGKVLGAVGAPRASLGDRGRVLGAWDPKSFPGGQREGPGCCGTPRTSLGGQDRGESWVPWRPKSFPGGNRGRFMGAVGAPKGFPGVKITSFPPHIVSMQTLGALPGPLQGLATGHLHSTCPQGPLWGPWTPCGRCPVNATHALSPAPDLQPRLLPSSTVPLAALCELSPAAGV